MLCVGYWNDTPGEMESSGIKNVGHVERKKWSSGRMYIGRLLNDIFQQSRYMLNNVNVKIKLIRAEPEFALINHTSTAKARFEINSAKLSIRRVRVSSAVMI